MSISQSCFLVKIFTILLSYLDLWSIWNWFFCILLVRKVVSLHFFCSVNQYPQVLLLNPSLWKNNFLRCSAESPLKSQITFHVCIFFRSLSLSTICLFSIFVPIEHWFNNYNLLIGLNIWQWKYSRFCLFVFFFEITLDILCLWISVCILESAYQFPFKQSSGTLLKLLWIYR